MEKGKVVANADQPGYLGETNNNNNNNNGIGLYLALENSIGMPADSGIGGGVSSTSSLAAAIGAAPAPLAGIPTLENGVPLGGMTSVVQAPEPIHNNNNRGVTLALPAAGFFAGRRDHRRHSMNAMMMMRRRGHNGVGVEAEPTRMRFSRRLLLPVPEDGHGRGRPMMQRVLVLKWSEEAGRRVAAVAGVMTDYTRPPIMIVCVCHQHCFTPTEFVYHATGRRAADPLRHIMVLPPFPF